MSETKVDAVIEFIRDQPSEVDSFEAKAHERLAQAIADAMRAHQDLQIVGLLGDWGSGKSTVVGLVEAKLADDVTGPGRFWVFDAWENQSEAPRRIFLERCIEFLESERRISAKDAHMAREDLRRPLEVTDTEVTTWVMGRGRLLVLLSLLAVPLGMQFIRRDWLFKSGDTTLDMAFAWPFFLGLLLVLGPLLAAAFMVFHDSQRIVTPKSGASGPEDIFSSLLNRPKEAKREARRRDPEPTAMEFQKLFRDLMAKAQDARLVIVVDNLDRLSGKEAGELWSAVRSLFLGRSDPGGCASLPTVILPVNPTAMKHLLSLPDGPGDGGFDDEGLYEKTFDVVFWVTRPVPTDWRRYLANQMEQVFSSAYVHAWGVCLAQFLEVRFESRAITPRRINSTINSLAALWLQWRGTEVTFAAAAYYAVFRSKLTQASDLLRALNNPQAGLDDLDPEWRRNIAAIHFGARPEKAVQILFEQELPRILRGADTREIVSMAEIEGFAEALDGLLRKAAVGEVQLPIGALVPHLLNLPDSPALRRFDPWSRARRILRDQVSLETLAPGDATALEAMLEHCPSAEAPAFMADLAEKLMQIHAPPNEPGLAKSLAALLDKIADCAAEIGQSPPALSLRVNPEVYLEVLGSLQRPVMRALVDTSHPPTAFAETLTREARDPDANMIGHVRIALERRVPVAWDGVLAGAHADLEGAIDVSQIVRSAHILGMAFPFESEAQRLVREFSGSPRLLENFKRFLDSGRDREAAQLLALSLLCDSPPPWDWSELLQKKPNLVKEVRRAVTGYWPGFPWQGLIVQAVRNEAVRPLAVAVIESQADAQRVGPIDPGALLEHLKELEPLAFGDKAKAETWGAVASSKVFWERARRQDDDASAYGLIALLKLGIAKAKAQRAAHARLRAASASAWMHDLRTGSPNLELLSLLLAKKLLNSPLPELLQTLAHHAPEVVSGKDRYLAWNWFIAVAALNPTTRKDLILKVRDLLLAGPVGELETILRFGMRLLIDDGNLPGVATRVVANFVMPLLRSHHAGYALPLTEVVAAAWRDEPHQADVIRDELRTLGALAEFDEERSAIQQIEALLFD